MELKITGVPISGEWTREDWFDFYTTLRKFEERVAARHKAAPPQVVEDEQDKEVPCTCHNDLLGKYMAFCPKHTPVADLKY